jgi:hypothetical protein
VGRWREATGTTLFLVDLSAGWWFVGRSALARAENSARNIILRIAKRAIKYTLSNRR